MIQDQGRFITVEGIDGSGKSTALGHLSEALARQGIPAVTTREPGGTELAEAIRDLLLGTDREAPCADTETLLMFAARAQHLERLIRPALARGKWVLCDRFTDATYAYQGGGRGIPDERIRALASWTHPGLAPHRTLLLDVPVAEGRHRRAAARGDEDRLEGEGEAFLGRVRSAYLRLASAEPDRIRLVDAAQPWTEVAAELEAWLEREVSRWRTGA